MGAQNTRVTSQVIKIIHDNRNKQIQHLENQSETNSGKPLGCYFDNKSVKKATALCVYQKGAQKYERHEVRIGQRRATLLAIFIQLRFAFSVQARQHYIVPGLSSCTTDSTKYFN